MCFDCCWLKINQTDNRVDVRRAERTDYHISHSPLKPRAQSWCVINKPTQQARRLHFRFILCFLQIRLQCCSRLTQENYRSHERNEMTSLTAVFWWWLIKGREKSSVMWVGRARVVQTDRHTQHITTVALRHLTLQQQFTLAFNDVYKSGIPISSHKPRVHDRPNKFSVTEMAR